MSDIHLPGGVRLQAPDPIVEALAPLLQSIVNQLDLLIRIQCGNMDRADVKAQLDAFDNKAKAAANGHPK